METSASALIEKAKKLRANSIFNPKNHFKAETITKLDEETDEGENLN